MTTTRLLLSFFLFTILGGSSSAVNTDTISESHSLIAPKIPSAKDPKLQNLVDDLYKGAKTMKPIGSGSTADAIWHEMRTGQQVGGVRLQPELDFLRN